MEEKTSPCPVCGWQPTIKRCEYWPRWMARAPWYVGCSRSVEEHYIGVNGDDKADALKKWTDAVRSYRIASEQGMPPPPKSTEGAH